MGLTRITNSLDNHESAIGGFIDQKNAFYTVDNGIYTNFPLKSVCRRSQTAGRNSCSIVSGDVSNCSYSLKVHPVTSSRLSPA